MSRLVTDKTAVLIALIFLVLASGAAADARRVASYDRLPLGDWTYDAMMKLAGDGLIPGTAARVFQGDRLFDRMEMAELLARVVAESDTQTLRPGQATLIHHLLLEFKPELAVISPEIGLRWAEMGMDKPAKDPLLLGYVRGLARDDSGGESNLFVPYRVTGFAGMSSEAFLIGTLADREEQFFHQLRENPLVDKVAVRGANENFTWAIGREYLNWGSAYSGSVILSDNAPAFWQARGAGDVNFGRLLGHIKITQFASVFEDDGQRLYLLGRRYEKQLSDRWNLGISETAKMNKSPNPLMLVMPFYLYQYLFLDSVDENINTLYGTDLSYRTASGLQVYGELAIDDITAPRLFGDRFERPRKTGWTLGVYVPQVIKGPRESTFRAEYTFIDRQTYEATRPSVPELAYIHDHRIIGHPIGPNAKALYLRGEHYLSDKWSLIGEYLDQRQVEAGQPERGEMKVFSLQAAYDIAPDFSVSLRIAPYTLTPVQGEDRNDTRYDLRASYAF